MDPAVSMSYLGDPPRHAAGAEVQLAREAAVAVVARVGEGGAQLNTAQIIRVISLFYSVCKALLKIFAIQTSCQ